MSINLRLTLVWVFVSAITILAWWLATHGEDGLRFDIGVTVSVMIIALFKAWFIIRDFMEARLQPAWVRTFTIAWMALLFGTCLGLYLYAALR